MPLPHERVMIRRERSIARPVPQAPLRRGRSSARYRDREHAPAQLFVRGQAQLPAVQRVRMARHVPDLRELLTHGRESVKSHVPEEWSCDRKPVRAP